MPITLRAGRIPGQVHEVVLGNDTTWDARHAIEAAFGPMGASAWTNITVNGREASAHTAVEEGALVLFRVAAAEEAVANVDVTVVAFDGTRIHISLPETATVAQALERAGLVLTPDQMLLDSDDDTLEVDTEVEYLTDIHVVSRNVLIKLIDERDASQREFMVDRRSPADVGDFLEDVVGYSVDTDYLDEPTLNRAPVSLQITADDDDGLDTDITTVRQIVIRAREVEDEEDEEEEWDEVDEDDDDEPLRGEGLGAGAQGNGMPGNVVEIKIGRIPGPVETYAVVVGTTVAEALALTGRMPEAGEVVRMNGMNVRLEDTITGTQSLLVFRA